MASPNSARVSEVSAVGSRRGVARNPSQVPKCVAVGRKHRTTQNRSWVPERMAMVRRRGTTQNRLAFRGHLLAYGGAETFSWRVDQRLPHRYYCNGQPYPLAGYG